MNSKKVYSINITPAYLDYKTSHGANYVVPILENEKLTCFKHKFFDNLILPEPFKEIFIGRMVGEGFTQISVIDATEIKNYKKYFKMFRGEDEEDLFSGLENSSFFKKLD